MNPEAIREQSPESRIESRAEIMERAREERAAIADSYIDGVLNPDQAEQNFEGGTKPKFSETYRYKLSRAAQFVRTLAPITDVETFSSMAEESEGIKKLRYKTAASICALYWQFASQGKVGVGAGFTATAALAALRIPIEENAKVARFVEAGSKLLENGKEYFSAVSETLMQYMKNRPQELAIDEADSS